MPSDQLFVQQKSHKNVAMFMTSKKVAISSSVGGSSLVLSETLHGITVFDSNSARYCKWVACMKPRAWWFCDSAALSVHSVVRRVQLPTPDLSGVTALTSCVQHYADC